MKPGLKYLWFGNNAVNEMLRREPNGRCYHSGCQGTYSRTALSLLDSLTRARNTASTSSFWSSSMADVLVPSHSASIQRRFLSLALAFSPPV